MGYHPLEHKVLHTIRCHHLFGSDDHLLIALSGGIDSMVMLHLLNRLHFPLTAAHVNFGLRGSQSDEDASFCEQVCSDLKIPIHITITDIKNSAKDEGISIQMAARKHRYNWFNELVRMHGFKFIVTAHHLNDQAETIILNLAEGKSAGSLRGIPVRNGNIVRPFIEISREEIEAYAREKNILWRDDESNFTDHYKRNFLRHKIMPLLEEMQPAAISNISRTSVRMQEWNLLAEERINEILHPCFEDHDETIVLHLQTIQQHPSAKLLLWKALSPYGFEGNVIDDIANHISSSGNIYTSEQYRITIDRDKLILEPLYQTTPENKILDATNSPVRFGTHSFILRIEDRKQHIPAAGSNIALLDADKLKFPLIIRTWQKGDSFTPLGMKTAKKLSDFFIDRKIPVPVKTRIPIVCSGKEIVWIGGQRINEHFKITDETRKIAIIELR